MSFISIQINSINLYELDSFPERKVKDLVSDLNINYSKINKYIEAQVDKEKINIEVINSLTNLEEIYRLVPIRMQSGAISGEFRLGIDLLESIIALLNTQSGHKSTRNGLLTLGWNLLNRLYSFSYDRLRGEALLFHWLKRYHLVRENEISTRRYRGREEKERKIKFSPSEEDVDSFYEENREKIYRYMVYEMGQNQLPSDPFLQSDAADFYHFHQTLSNINPDPEAAA